jgi:hypothetical protein
MTSVKCPQCGLVNWSTTANCKRCGLAVAEGPADDQQFDQSQSYASPAVKMLFETDSVNEEHLIRNLKRDSLLFYFIGGLQSLLWFFIGNLLILDGVLNIGLSYVANRFRSRVAAISLVLLTVLSVLAALVAIGSGELRPNLLTIVVLVGRVAASIRMVYCTFKLSAQVKVDVTRMMPPLPPVFHQDEDAQWTPPGGSVQLQPE